MTDRKKHDAPRIEIVDVGARGRGVIASAPIAKGELIERAPVGVYSEKQTQLLMENKLDTYLWKWNEGDDITLAAVAFGLISLCNHSSYPSCTIEKDLPGRTISLVALRNIAKDEELTLKYLTTEADFVDEG